MLKEIKSEIYHLLHPKLTVAGAQAQKDSFFIRQSSLQYKVPYTTTISGAIAVVNTIEMLKKSEYI